MMKRNCHWSQLYACKFFDVKDLVPLGMCVHSLGFRYCQIQFSPGFAHALIEDDVYKG
jgi:hypothetical protein